MHPDPPEKPPRNYPRGLTMVIVLTAGFVALAHLNFHVAGGAPFDPNRLVLPGVVGAALSYILCELDRARRHAQESLAMLREARDAAVQLSLKRAALVAQVERQWQEADREAQMARVALGAVHDVRNLLQTVATAGFVLREEGGALAEVGADLDFVVQHGRELCNRALEQRASSDAHRGTTDAGTQLSTIARAAASLLPVATEVQVDADAARLRVARSSLLQVFHNLFANSAAAKGEGLRLWVSGTWQDDAYVVQIRDNGPGFPPGWPDGSDRGFGLTVVSGLIERRGGMVRFPESRSGALVELVFPNAERPRAEVSSAHLQPPRVVGPVAAVLPGSVVSAFANRAGR